MDHDGTRSEHKESSDNDTWTTAQIQAEGLHNCVDLSPPTLLTTGEAIQGKTPKRHCNENKCLRQD
jgi:hypothetical protein